mmetsp:Transcript_25080/g.36734  ORF Transcript_25080/g.36734 Transcript_25080/m.36734 type:complete len:83 (+) Transcript_25080:23-271(+)
MPCSIRRGCRFDGGQGIKKNDIIVTPRVSFWNRSVKLEIVLRRYEEENLYKIERRSRRRSGVFLGNTYASTELNWEHEQHHL